MVHACCLLRREQVAAGGLEELKNGLCLERRRVRQVDHHLRALERVGHPFAG
jgi:hypothetical protein